jgi:uncharacterized membrane protein
MPTIETSIDVCVPMETAYDQWKQFEKLPQFMKCVKEIKRLDDNPLQWKADGRGQDPEWEPEITDHAPDHGGAHSCQPSSLTEGVVTFQPVSDAMSKVLLQLAYTHGGVIKTMQDELAAVSSCMQEELERFKAFAECGQAAGTSTNNLPYQAFPS